MRDAFDPLEALAAQACPNGGWGYAPDQCAHLEPTCLALLALSREPQRYAAAIASGQNWLRQCATGDGMYRLERGRAEAIWPTALVLFTQAVLGHEAAALNATAAALLGRKGRQVEAGDEEEINDIDGQLIGWPWAEGNFSWVEPTAWACLALRRIGQAEHPRVREGMNLLLDRALEGGGVNYGNRCIFGTALEPIPGPTALMLLALQGRSDDPRIAAAVSYLGQQALASEDLEHLCWTSLALDVYADRVGVRDILAALGERIRAAHAARAETPWLRPAPLRQALTALALGIEECGALAPRVRSDSRSESATQGNPFRLPSEQVFGGTGVSPVCPSKTGETPVPPLRTGGTGVPPVCPSKTPVPPLRTGGTGVPPVCPSKTGETPVPPLRIGGTGVPPVCPSKTGETPVPPLLMPCEPISPKRSLGQRLKAKFQGLVIHAATQLRQLDAQSAVHVAPIGDYNGDLADVVSRQYEHFRARVPLAGKRVVLKPNLVEYHRDKVINTHPHLVAAAIELCRREGAAEILVAEGPGHWRNVEYLVAASGLGDVLRHYNVPFVDLNHDEPIKRPNLGRLTGLDHLYLSQTVATADVVISLPKLKTHHWAAATLSLKNLFGTLPGICYGWPKNELHWRGIDNSIVDIAATRTPDLAIVDGIVGMEGDGPLNGTPKPMGVVVMGSDLVAVDATCCRLMQLDPERVGYLVLGNRKRLGQLAAGRILQLGETIEERAQPFDTVPHFRPLWLGRSNGYAVAPARYSGEPIRNDVTTASLPPDAR